MKIKNYLFIGCLSFLLLNSCEKPEGIGGNGIISGTVNVNVYDKDFKVLQTSYPADDEDVFIIYGNNEVVSDNTETSYNGKYEFRNLGKGNYTLFVYSEDMSGNTVQDIAIDTIVELNARDDEVKNVNFTISKTIDYDDGKASISGKIFQINWKAEVDTTRAQELDVYLLFENKFIDRTRTLQDGSYIFSGLLKGNYTILAYSDDILTGGTEKIAMEKTITIEAINDNKIVESIYIIND